MTSFVNLLSDEIKREKAANARHSIIYLPDATVVIACVEVERVGSVELVLGEDLDVGAEPLAADETLGLHAVSVVQALTLSVRIIEIFTKESELGTFGIFFLICSIIKNDSLHFLSS